MGSARTALFNWLFARHEGGSFILRLEDTDQARSSEAHAHALCTTLRWLGLGWDEGPEVGGAYGPYNQMARLPIYHQALADLRKQESIYACYCTPEELAERREAARQASLPPRYDGRCRRLSAREREALEAQGRRPAWRLQLPADQDIVVHDLIRGDVRIPLSSVDDFIVARSDGVPTYNFVVAVDDAAMGISHVLRADEHLANTPKQLLVMKALGSSPPAYGHLPMVLAADRSKLSKRHGSVAIEEYRDMGLIPEGIVNYCALLGWSSPDGVEVMTPDDLVAAFELSRVGKSAATYDLAKLKWMNAQHLRRMAATEVAHRAEPWLRSSGLLAQAHDPELPELSKAIGLVQERIETLAEIPDAIRYFYVAPASFDAAGAARHFSAASGGLLRAVNARLSELPRFDEASVERAYRDVADDLGVRAAALIHPTRLALTGRTVGPGLFAVMAVIGRAECQRRLAAAAERMQAGA
jgi:glutamyl-tRNA synthetase